MGTCCGQISRARDILIGSIPDGGWIASDKFVELRDTLGSHDGFNDLFDNPDAYVKTSPEDPLVVLGWIWMALRDRLGPPAPTNPRDPVKDAWVTLSSISTCMWVSDMFWDSRVAQTDADRIFCEFCISKLIPAMSALNAALPSYFPNGPVTYLVVVQTNSPDVPLELRRGPAFFKDMTSLRESAGYWSTSEPDTIQDLSYRQVTLSPQGMLIHGDMVSLLTLI